MNKNKDENLQKSVSAFLKARLQFTSFNEGMHWKIGTVNYYPTTMKWFDEELDEHGFGVSECIKHIKSKIKEIKIVTVEEIFEIAKHAKDRSLIGICREIHKGIYK